MRHLAVTHVLLGVTALAPFRADAAECTDTEVAHDDELWASAATQSACAPYASGASAFYWPCDAADCTAVLATMAASLSDCTYSGVSNKIEVQNAITTCTGGETTDPGSPTTAAPSTTAPASATTAPSPAATASTTDCVTTEVTDMVDLYAAAATSDECADSASVSATSIVITTFCGSGAPRSSRSSPLPCPTATTDSSPRTSRQTCWNNSMRALELTPPTHLKSFSIPRRPQRRHLPPQAPPRRRVRHLPRAHRSLPPHRPPTPTPPRSPLLHPPKETLEPTRSPLLHPPKVTLEPTAKTHWPNAYSLKSTTSLHSS
ncbi:hypothetical protein PHYPSEUDO_001748 [Phytophthora pseudosyringae]|uniref:Elicitin n=1 Tax=Phytophthora pseudosyringae TaxID=221518 RepID=A0A8T1VWA7_9STRA|nr:hypothetical protein PHYPSEUDO_001748 [Phytophthora pseudosyringae]